jgi:Transposase DDE domain group 1
MTECIQPCFPFAPHFSRDVVARFDGGQITTEAGALLLRPVEQRTGILRQFAACFCDYRRADRVEHSVSELVRQRVYGIALGYEDLNDHDQLRQDPLLALLSGKRDLEGEHRRREQDRGKAGAGKSTLNRLELTPADAKPDARYKKIVMDEAAVDGLLVDLYIQTQPRQPKRIVLDLDATDDPVHGEQEGRFFHGYYGCYCYLPLYIFIDEHLVCARLRPSNIDASAGALEEVQRIVKRLRFTWPGVRIVLRADSGFCRDALMSWCEKHRVGYVFGLAKNERLVKKLRKPMQEAQRQWKKTGKPARRFREFRYRTRESWKRGRRVVGKAEYLDKGENPRFVVTSLCAEEMEARSLEQQLDLFADRTSTSWLHSNQIRLYLSSIAYCILAALRRLALVGTDMAQAQCGTIRLRLLKIGAQVRITARKIWISMAAGHPAAAVFAAAHQKLMGGIPLRA